MVLLSVYISYCDGFVPSPTNIASSKSLHSRNVLYNRNHNRQQHLRAVVTPLSSVSSAPNPVPIDQRFNSGVSVSPRIKRIKDSYQTREIVNDLTACEFALIVDMKTNKAKIDYGKLIAKLDKDSVLLAQRDIDGDKQLNSRLIELKVAEMKAW